MVIFEHRIGTTFLFVLCTFLEYVVYGYYLGHLCFQLVALFMLHMILNLTVL